MKKIILAVATPMVMGSAPAFAGDADFDPTKPFTIEGQQEFIPQSVSAGQEKTNPFLDPEPMISQEMINIGIVVLTLMLLIVIVIYGLPRMIGWMIGTGMRSYKKAVSKG